MIPLLAGVRILEVGAVVLAPYAGQILADLGAEVIKVEPVEGDIARAAFPGSIHGGALFVNNNRNKRMLAIDLKRPEGREVMMRLIRKSDVLLHNMRVDAAARLGLDPTSVAAINPAIIHCAAVGFGQQGRHRDRPAFDDIIQAESGLAGLAMETGGDPQFVPTILADKVAALHAVYGILAALVARGRGNSAPISIEVPMFEAVSAFLLNEHLSGATFSADGKPGYPRILSPDRRPYRTADGWIAVLPYTEQQWRRFFEEIGRPEIGTEPWFADARTRQARISELYAIVAAALTARTTGEWLDALSARDVPCARVNGLADLLDDPHLADVAFFRPDPDYPPEIVRMLPQPVRYDGIERRADDAPHAIGADSRAILIEAGMSGAEVDALVASGVIAAPPDESAAEPGPF